MGGEPEPPAIRAASACVTQTRPGSVVLRLPVRKQPTGGPHTPGYAGIAALTAVPVMSKEYPARVSRPPTCTPSALANDASTTTPPGRTQVPWVTFGRSTAEGAVLRPSASALPIVFPVRSGVQVTGNGPLAAATPAACPTGRRLPGPDGPGPGGLPGPAFAPAPVPF